MIRSKIVFLTLGVHVNLDNEMYVENVAPFSKHCNKNLLQKFLYFSAQTLSLFGERFKKQKITKCDMGEGVQNVELFSDILF